MKNQALLIVSLLLLAACAAPPTAIPPGARTPTAAPVPESSPTPAAVITSAEQAIAAAQQKYPDLNGIKPAPTGAIGASTNITAQEQPDGWNLVFWKGSGDCPAGCINNHYWYVSVKRVGTMTLAGEYVREFDAGANAFKTSGQPLWGVPK